MSFDFRLPFSFLGILSFACVRVHSCRFSYINLFRASGEANLGTQRYLDDRFYIIKHIQCVFLSTNIIKPMILSTFLSEHTIQPMSFQHVCAKAQQSQWFCIMSERKLDKTNGFSSCLNEKHDKTNGFNTICPSTL